MLQAFKDNMRWASKLASEQFKTEHFIELFSAIGLNYDANRAYTLQELIDLNLDEHSELINRIYKRALTELKLNQQFSSIENLWSNKLLFNLAKHFPINVYKTGKINHFSICVHNSYKTFYLKKNTCFHLQQNLFKMQHRNRKVIELRQ